MGRLERIRSKSPAELRRIIRVTVEHRLQEWAVRTNSESLLARVASLAYRSPSRRLKLLGITGSAGKGSTGYLLHEALSVLDQPSGFIGTGRVEFEGKVRKSGLTTPPTLVLNRSLRAMVDAGVRAAILEVSSHGIEGRRIAGLRFDVGVFTNFRPDHLDFHGTAEAYAACKARFFSSLSRNAVAVVNADDPMWKTMVSETSARVVTFGSEAIGDRNIAFRIHRDDLDGLDLSVDGGRIRSPLIGAFNAYNLAGAYAAGAALGIPRNPLLDALASARGLPGRLQRVIPGEYRPHLPTVLIDFARSPQKLAAMLDVVRSSGDTFVTCLVSSCGERDPQRRPVLGRILEEKADLGVITVGNPRSESPETLVAEIAEGYRNGGCPLLIPDRAAAIRTAILEAPERSVVVIAGKGHESVDHRKEGPVPWSDYQEAASALDERVRGGRRPRSD